MARDHLTVVQRSALERALVDDVDARRYFALAGALDGARRSSPLDVDEDESGGRIDRRRTPESGADREAGARDTNGADPPVGTDARTRGVLPATLLSLAVVLDLDDRADSVSTGSNPWTPGADATHPAVRRGARLALRWFDVPLERVAARAGLPEAVLASTDD